jgi:hypothetical protein
MAGIEITKMSLVTYAGEEVSTVNAADPITKYYLRIYYTSTVSGYGIVAINFSQFSSGTIADLLRTYATNASSLVICVDSIVITKVM